MGRDPRASRVGRQPGSPIGRHAAQRGRGPLAYAIPTALFATSTALAASGA